MAQANSHLMRGMGAARQCSLAPRIRRHLTGWLLVTLLGAALPTMAQPFAVAPSHPPEIGLGAGSGAPVSGASALPLPATEDACPMAEGRVDRTGCELKAASEDAAAEPAVHFRPGPETAPLAGRRALPPWLLDEHSPPETPQPRLSATNNQHALYTQDELLTRQFKALKPNDPDRTELYVLLLAGDGTQEVFRREVEWIDRSLDQRFDTQGRTIMLVNSRHSVHRLPLATEVSLSRALAALAQRMDLENDLLLVYLTSHGSRTHELEIAMPNMALPPLSARGLAALLEGSGIRQQVVVVSACFAGGFIEPLRSPTRWVIAAAREDRSSFGCSDDSDFTYFGRALFQEALPQSDTLSAAFEVAKLKVAEWERALRASPGGALLQHSEPQMEVMPDFQRRVDAWFARHARPAP